MDNNLSPIFLQMLGWIGNTISTISYFAPILQLQEVHNTGDTSRFPDVMILCSFATNLVYLLYGIKIKSAELIFSSVIGTIMSYFMLFLFYIMANKTTVQKIYKILSLNLTFSVFYYLFTVPFNDLSTLGFSCMIFNLFSSLSPLACILAAYAESSREIIPITNLLINLISSVVWFSYGKLADDNIVIMFPNLISGIICVIGMSSYLLLPEATKQTSEEDEKQKITLD